MIEVINLDFRNQSKVNQLPTLHLLLRQNAHWKTLLKLLKVGYFNTFYINQRMVPEHIIMHTHIQSVV